jgi:hypothetical protein
MSNSLNLTNTRQDTLLTEKYPNQPRRAKARLTAIKPLKTKEGLGIVWFCRCDCGGSREVLARDFANGRIKKCAECVNPFFRNQQKQLTKTRREAARSLGDPWYSAEYRENWRRHLAEFNTSQKFLFEVICDGRIEWIIQFQAVQIVMLETDIKLELQNFSVERRRRALERMKKDNAENLPVSRR